MTITSATKQKIVEVAIDLFSRQSYDTVSVRDIARIVGIKDSSVYSHFASKNEILDTIIDLMRRQFLNALPNETEMEDIFQKCSANQFMEIGFQRFQQRVADPLQARIYLIMIREQFNDSRAGELWQAHRNQVIDYMETAFRIMITKGWLKELDPRQMATSYELAHLGLLSDYIRKLCKGDATQSISDEIQRHRDFFLNMVRR